MASKKVAANKKPVCKYGKKCYRKNPQHFKEFIHNDILTTQEDDETADPPKKKAKIQDFFSNRDTNLSVSDSSSDSKIDKIDDTDASQTEPVHSKQEVSASESEADDKETDRPASPEDVGEDIKSKFLVAMPEDFYEFWEFAKSVDPTNPSGALCSSLGLRLVGPYDVVSGKTKSKSSSKKKRPNYLLHYRYYYDPPELLTVVSATGKSQFHMGYFRDDPKDMPVFVASNDASDNCTLRPRGGNIFAAINSYIDDALPKANLKRPSMIEIQKKLKSWVEKCGISLDQKTTRMKDRDKKVVSKSFHGAGIVVPLDDTGVGYRPLPETPASLKKMFKKISDSKTEEERDTAFEPLMEIITCVQFANDECDYGQGLELGLDLFSFGGDVFHKTISNLLPLAYQLLGRQAFADIIKAHLECRKFSDSVDQLA